MKAYLLEQAKTPPKISAVPLPKPGPGEVLVRVAACGLNFADLLTIEGTYQEMPPLPAALGKEYAGTVEEVGPDVSLPVGTRVAVYTGHGGLADYAVAPADRCLPIPDAMPFDVAAGFQIAYGTSHLALTRTARLTAGETLLVLGAAGGVGLTAVEIGATLGATVIGVARGEDRLAVAKQAGATHLIDGRAEDTLRDAVKALGGADVVYDAVGGTAFREAMRATNPEGRILAIGFASGDVPQIPANHLLVKNISVHGFYWGGFLNFAPDVLHHSLKELVDWYVAGRIKPHISHSFPLDQAAEALNLLRSRRATGKIVVTP
ncbi:MAG: NADPH:quinone oxidoreductase family protein [Pseudomonadota bacterium]